MGAALGARVGWGTHARGSPLQGDKGCGTCSWRKGCGAQALGELLGGGGVRWGGGRHRELLSEKGGLKYGEGNVRMRDERARAVGKHAAAGAQGPPSPAEPLAPHVHGCWCPWSLGLVPAGRLPQHLQAPQAAGVCPVKSHTSPRRVSICSTEERMAARGPRAQPRLSQGVCQSRLGCWCRSRSLGWLIPARRGRSPW